MPITVSCTECNTKLKAPDTAAGRKIKCPKCSAVIAVPADAVEDNISAAPPPERRPARDEDRDDDRRPARRPSRDDDDDRRPARRSSRDDDYDDDPRPASHIARGQEGPGTGAQLGLGIAGLVCGIIGALFSWIPFCGAVVAWPMCGIGLALGGTGLIIALVKKVGYAFPIAGTAVSVAGLAFSLFWYFWFVAALHQVGKGVEQGFKELDKAAKQKDEDLKKKMEEEAKRNKDKFNPIDKDKNQKNDMDVDPPQGELTPASKAIILVKGRTVLELETLTRDDPEDRIRKNPCKIYSLEMKAGLSYKISMLSKTDNKLHPFLRLENAAGKQVAFNDSRGKDAILEFNCPANGIYRVIATTGPGNVGNYRLRVDEK